MSKPSSPSRANHMVIQAFKNLIGKLRQSPDVYPIRYYKKNRRFGSYNRQIAK